MPENVVEPPTLVGAVGDVVARLDSLERKPESKLESHRGGITGTVRPGQSSALIRPRVACRIVRLSAHLDSQTTSPSTFRLLRDGTSIATATVASGATYVVTTLSTPVMVDVSSTLGFDCSTDGKGWTAATVEAETDSGQMPVGGHVDAPAGAGPPAGNYQTSSGLASVAAAGSTLTNYNRYVETTGFTSYLTRVTDGWTVKRACVAYLSFVVQVTGTVGTGVSCSLLIDGVSGTSVRVADEHAISLSANEMFTAGGIFTLTENQAITLFVDPTANIDATVGRLDAIILAPLETNFTGGE